MCALIDGEEDALLFFEGGKYLSVNSENPFDLFIVTPEPEMTAFEKKVYAYCDGKTVGEELIKRIAKELLGYARKELEPEVLERLEVAYKNQDEVVYENGKRDGKAEALKDLPRWKKAKEYMKLGPNDFVLILDRDGKCSPYWDTEVEEGQFYITESDIENLPKED